MNYQENMHSYLTELTVIYVPNNSAAPQYQLIRKTDNMILAQCPKGQPLIDLCEALKALHTLMGENTPTNTTKLLASIGKLIDAKAEKQ